MKSESRIYAVSIALLVLMATSLMLQTARADTTTSGGSTAAVEIRETFTIHQGKYPNATDLHFRLYSDTEIVGWEVTVSHFTNSTSLKHDFRSVNVTAGGAIIPYCTDVTVDATIWTRIHNYLKIDNIRWTNYTQELVGGPDHGWEVDYSEVANATRYYNHTLVFRNYDATETFTVTGFAVNASVIRFSDLADISFPPAEDNFTLAPGESRTFIVTTLSRFLGGHIYFTYTIVWNGDPVIVAIADHPVLLPVGGLMVPIDKFGALAPFIGFTSIVLGTVLATAIYVKRVKRKK